MARLGAQASAVSKKVMPASIEAFHASWLVASSVFVPGSLPHVADGLQAQVPVQIVRSWPAMVSGASGDIFL